MLEQMRTAITEAAPRAEEAISYAMPAYRLNGMLVYFAGYAKHIGFYPGAGAIAVFKKELSSYKGAKRICPVSAGSAFASKIDRADREVSRRRKS